MSAIGVYAETYTYTSSSAETPTDGIVTLNNVKWTVNYTNGKGSANWGNYDKTKGWQMGTSKNWYSELSFSTSEIEGTINSIKVNTSGAKDTNAEFSVKVGGEACTIGTATSQNLTATATEYTFTPGSVKSGEIVLAWSQTSEKALYLKSITIDYTPAGGVHSLIPDSLSLDHLNTL